MILLSAVFLPIFFFYSLSSCLTCIENSGTFFEPSERFEQSKKTITIISEMGQICHEGFRLQPPIFAQCGFDPQNRSELLVFVMD